jgi:antitoxin (DNA-binding transcriptional repressor) of toxin-antitoxin stability system
VRGFAVALEDSDFICGNWVWDPALRELRHYERKGKKGSNEPDAIEQLKTVRSVSWHRWSQAPMQTSTGQTMPPSLSRVVAAYEAGGDLTINENDRACAEKLASTIAEAHGLPVIEEGAPGGRRRGNLPSRDQMGRLVNEVGREQVILDEVGGEITITKRGRVWGKKRRTFRTNEIRHLELGSDVKGPVETFTVWAVVGPEEKLPLASYSGFEGWADPEEWREFTRELGRSLGVEAVV